MAATRRGSMCVAHVRTHTADSVLKFVMESVAKQVCYQMWFADWYAVICINAQLQLHQFAILYRRRVVLCVWRLWPRRNVKGIRTGQASYPSGCVWYRLGTGQARLVACTPTCTLILLLQARRRPGKQGDRRALSASHFHSHLYGGHITRYCFPACAHQYSYYAHQRKFFMIHKLCEE